MSDGFNPYSEWLQVAGSERPNHYRLLGLPTFAHDPEEINRVAQEKIRLVRTYQMGPQRAEALRIIGELSDAYACLSNPESKRTYDQQLRQAATVVADRPETLSDSPPAPLAAVSASPIPPVAASNSAVIPSAVTPMRNAPPPEDSPTTVPAEAADENDEAGSGLVWVVGGIATVIGAVVLAIAFFLNGGSEIAKVEPPSLPAKTVWKNDVNSLATNPEIEVGDPSDGAANPEPAITESKAIETIPDPAPLPDPIVAPPAVALTKLRCKFKPGDTLSYVLVQRTVGTNDTKPGTTSETTLDTTWEIESVDAAGLAVMSQRLDRIQMKLQSESIKFDYDSQAATRPNDLLGALMSPVLDALIGPAFVMKVNDRGESSDFQMPETLTAAVKASPFTANLTQMLRESMLRLPEEGLKVGDYWKRISESKTPPFTQKTENTYAYAGPEIRDGRRLEKILLSLKFGIDVPPDSSVAVNITSQEAKGTILFDNAAGRIVESTYEPRITMEVTSGGTKTLQKSKTISTMKWTGPVAAAVSAPMPTAVGPPAAPVAPAAGVSGPALLQAPFDAATAIAAQKEWAAHLKQKAEQTNSIGMTLTLIPPGEFQMGAPAGEPETQGDERPQHPVRISRPFYLGQCEVTRGQFEKFAAELSGTDTAWKDPGFLQSLGHPVVNVSWDLTRRFCEWLSVKEGRRYRLPTEAEWEYACRAGTTTRFWHGSDKSKLGDHAWFDANAKKAPRVVGEKPANGFGLHDMNGNVCEWCADWYGENYYKEIGKTLAIDPQGPPQGPYRVRRGGGWNKFARYCGSACRDWWGPDSLGGAAGFRVVLVPDLTSAPAAAPVANSPAPLTSPFDKATAVAAQQAWAAHTKRKVEETNSIGMKLVYIPPGKFMMGSPLSEKERTAAEDQQEVQLTKGFYLGAYEVTQAEFEQVMESNPSFCSAGGNFSGRVTGQDTRRFPVDGVLWDEAQDFCQRLSKKEIKTYRLPTEAEWEYACRAGTTTVFHFGDSLSATQANFDGKSPYGPVAAGAGLERTAAVGSYLPNSFGLYDMHGNVWEWCRDEFKATLAGGQDPLADSLQARLRVYRGGGWYFNVGRDCRSASRDGSPPRLRNVNAGFRVVLIPPDR